MKLMKLTLQGPSLAGAPSKPLGGALTPCSQSHVFVKSAKVGYFNCYPLRPLGWDIPEGPKGSSLELYYSLGRRRYFTWLTIISGRG